jgi:hypothetical protein
VRRDVRLLGRALGLIGGAYSFCDRLGFRSAWQEVRALAEKEYARLHIERGNRLPIATLRRLAACDPHFDLDDGAEESSSTWRRRRRGPEGEGVANRAEALQRLSQRITGRLCGIAATGKAISWSEMRAYLEGRVAGRRLRRPVARKLAR